MTRPARPPTLLPCRTPFAPGCSLCSSSIRSHRPRCCTSWATWKQINSGGGWNPSSKRDRPARGQDRQEDRRWSNGGLRERHPGDQRRHRHAQALRSGQPGERRIRSAEDPRRCQCRRRHRGERGLPRHHGRRGGPARELGNRVRHVVHRHGAFAGREPQRWPVRDPGRHRSEGVHRPDPGWVVTWEVEPKRQLRTLPPELGAGGRFSFVGRERELVEARRAWAGVCSGEINGILIAGEPGVGKTRLAAGAGDRGNRRWCARPLRSLRRRSRGAVRTLRRRIGVLRRTRRARRERPRPLRRRTAPADPRPRSTRHRAAGHDRGRFEHRAVSVVRRGAELARDHRRRAAGSARRRRHPLGCRTHPALAAAPPAASPRGAALHARHIPRHRGRRQLAVAQVPRGDPTPDRHGIDQPAGPRRFGHHGAAPGSRTRPQR